MLATLVPAISFILITTFTPGPNNISSASMGVLYGYRGALRYMSGIAVGFFVVMVLSATVSTSLRTFVPAYEPVLRNVGAAYIVYLAYHTLRASYGFDAQREPMGFGRGFALQLLNPKAMVYGLTLFSVFLTTITQDTVLLLVAAALLAVIAFAAISTWALFGSAIRNYLHDERIKMLVNSVLALLLVYTALEVAGLL